MRNRINGPVLFSLGFVLVDVYLIYISLGYNQLARLVPLVVLIAGLIAAVVNLVLELRAAFGSKKEASAEAKLAAGAETETEKPKKEKKKLSPQEKWRREWVGIAWLLGLFAMITVLGQIVAIPLFVLLFMRYFGRESWRLSIAYAVVIVIFVYGLFIYGLRNELYPGILLPMLEK